MPGSRPRERAAPATPPDADVLFRQALLLALLAAAAAVAAPLRAGELPLPPQVPERGS